MKKQWVSTDAWRGYYKPVPPVGYEILLDCSVVNDAGEHLKKIITLWLRDKHIHYKTGYLRTSNVFSASLYIIVEENRIPKDLREVIENWFIDQNNRTFSIFSGDSWELDTESAQETIDTILCSGKYKLL
ncbi:MAG TPA: hypothetical protein VNG51_04575 [Ktedonobacteraceae bacterium]|nr:hypothetical protein [Ktedonobacteraceae bacterium]